MGKRQRVVVEADAIAADNAASYAIERRTTISTKNSYKNKIIMIKKWIAKHHSQFVVNDKLVLPLPENVILGYFGSLCAAGYSRNELSGPQSIDESAANEPYSPDYVTGFRSALVDYYSKNGMTISDEFNNKWKGLLKGYEKICNDLRKRGLMQLQAGKRHLRRDGYLLLCKKLMQLEPTANGGSWKTSMFGWAFFTLLWNLISRPDSIEDITLNRITWKEDCLAIDEQVNVYYDTEL